MSENQDEAAPRGLVEAVAATAEAHRPYGLDCKCGRPINSDADWAQHLSEAVIATQATLIFEHVKDDLESLRSFDDVPGMGGRAGAQIDTSADNRPGADPSPLRLRS